MICRLIRLLEPSPELLSVARQSALERHADEQGVLAFRITNLARGWQR